MKTAIQELIELLETQKRLFIEAERHTLADGIGRTILLSKQFLEKEKEQIIDFGYKCRESKNTLPQDIFNSTYN